MIVMWQYNSDLDLEQVKMCSRYNDWEAPTGGYLLSACFASGLAAGQGAAAWLAGRA